MKPFSKLPPAACCMYVVAILLFSPAATVAAQPADGMPEALKNIKQAGSMCMRTDALPAKSASGTIVAERQPDMSCAIGAAELLPQLGHTETTLVDTRLPAEYSAYRIAETLNMSVSELRTKPFLHSKNVVLIGNGKAERELYAACATLKAEGFKQVRVLRGGMPVWLSARHAVLGKPADVMEYTHLDSSELWGESQFDANLVLLVRGQAAMQQQLSAQAIPEANAAEIKRALEQRRRQGGKSPLAAVVVASAVSLTADAIQKLREAALPTPLLFYSGSVDVYLRQVAQQKAIWLAQANGPKQLGCGL
ncbi:hypothetical protein LT85_2246 [Collimonas arenae]|uniref:Rhodanese domain-containing protein n=1 Tax=Collimonas arenae TaxID=279058 RepID=A0A0A1FCK8_9BURK|nr:rhodanese-like domain-containing protein [Collimonas arenae]AIY41404.1 hypothetical protein LT85_2246 [Collimonas arenae]